MFPFVSTVTEIREAIQKLPPNEAWKLAQELHERLDGLWDEEFEQDVKAGRLDGVIARARAEHVPAKPDRWMKSSGTNEFWELYRGLPEPIKRAARRTYRTWKENPRAACPQV